MRRALVVAAALSATQAWADAKHPNPFLSQAKVFATQGEGDKCLKRLIQAEAKWKWNDKKDRAEIEMYGGICGYLVGETQAAEVSFKNAVKIDPKVELPKDLGPGIENAVIAIAITSWPPYARIARAETLMIRNSDFIAAVKLQGASTPRIILGHVVPLCISSLIVRVTLDMAGIILTAAGLGFLGLGAQPPMPEWGAMVATGRNYLIDQWWVAAMPGLAIFVVSLGFNLLGDGLRDVLDPKAAK